METKTNNDKKEHRRRSVFQSAYQKCIFFPLLIVYVSDLEIPFLQNTRHGINDRSCFESHRGLSVEQIKHSKKGNRLLLTHASVMQRR